MERLQNAPSIVVRRRFAFPAERVFDAWTNPDVARRWLFATRDGGIVRCDLDARPGGGLIVTDRRAGEDVEHRGTFLEADRPAHLAFTFSVPKYSTVVTTVDIRVESGSNGCHLTLTHHGVLPEWVSQTEQGWRDLLENLEKVLAKADPYETRLDILHGPLEIVDVQALADACTYRWYNQTLCQVNDSVVRLGVFEGEYHWHKHARDDEFFYVIEGRLFIDLEDRAAVLAPGQGFVVPRTVVHRTRATERTVVLMIETAAIVPTGDA